MEFLTQFALSTIILIDFGLENHNDISKYCYFADFIVAQGFVSIDHSFGTADIQLNLPTFPFVLTKIQNKKNKKKTQQNPWRTGPIDYVLSFVFCFLIFCWQVTYMSTCSLFFFLKFKKKLNRTVTSVENLHTVSVSKQQMVPLSKILLRMRCEPYSNICMTLTGVCFISAGARWLRFYCTERMQNSESVWRTLPTSRWRNKQLRISWTVVKCLSEGFFLALHSL